jgi:hypothetical protein
MEAHSYTAPIFSLASPKGGEGRGEEANVYKHEPLTPTLSPFGGERELFPFGAGVRMRRSVFYRAKLI